MTRVADVSTPLQPTAQPAFESGRIVHLDSLRGIAAVSVVIFHHFCAWDWFWKAYVAGPQSTTDVLLLSPVMYFTIAGHAAVILFYILSGYVLSRPILAGKPPPYLGYLAKRIARLYIPYAVCVLLTFLAAGVFSGQTTAGLSKWFNKPWQTPANLETVIDHALVLRNFDAWNFLPTIWSLVEEMRVSIVFPLIAAAVTRCSWMLVLGAACGLSAAGIFGQQFDLTGLSYYGSTLHYGAFFVGGALLARFRAPIQKFVSSLRPRTFALFGLTVLVIYAWDGLFHHVRVGPRSHKLLLDWPTAVGAAGLVVLASRISALNRPLLAWFGKISYSLYLCHLPVMLIVLKCGYGICPTWVLISLSLSLSFAVAALLYQYVELPSIILGRKLSMWISNLVGARESRLANQTC